MGNQYEDIYGRTHVISEEIARGGQGAVYRTLDSNIALKIEINLNTGEIVMDESNNDKFDNIRILPIPENLNVTLPRAALKGCAGYVMTLLEDMESFSKAFDKELEDLYINQWLKDFVEDNEDFVKGFGSYIATGGKRRRILAYLKCACIIAKLHASGLVYCDFSPNNVFISSDMEYSNVWLIDADNLNYQSITIKGGYYTPGYAAPEVVKRKGCTFYSDNYSFAVSLFWQLTGTHPFKGQLVEEGIEDDFADNVEEKAYSGEFPWIADVEDDSNATETTIPYQSILSGKIMDCFERTFSQKGKGNRVLRTSMFEWAETLAYENDNTVKCHHCEMEYLPENEKHCPWCDSENNLIRIKSFVFYNEQKCSNIWSFCHDIKEGITKHIPVRVVEGFGTDSIDSYLFDLNINEGRIILSNFSLDMDFALCNGNENKIRISGKVEIDYSSKLICKANKTNEMILIEVDVI